MPIRRSRKPLYPLHCHYICYVWLNCIMLWNWNYLGCSRMFYCNIINILTSKNLFPFKIVPFKKLHISNYINKSWYRRQGNNSQVARLEAAIVLVIPYQSSCLFWNAVQLPVQRVGQSKSVTWILSKHLLYKWRHITGILPC